MFISENKKIRIENNSIFESKEKIPQTWYMVSSHETFNQALKHGLELCRDYNYTVLCSERR